MVLSRLVVVVVEVEGLCSSLLSSFPVFLGPGDSDFDFGTDRSDARRHLKALE